MNILITGMWGYIGSVLGEVLLEKEGYVVSGIEHRFSRVKQLEHLIQTERINDHFFWLKKSILDTYYKHA